jgi:putative FmdB family regulatory protein
MEFPLLTDYNTFLSKVLEVVMPTYEFRCLDCRRRFEAFFTYDEYGSKAVNCPNCESTNVQRKIGRIRFAKSEDSRMEDLASDFSDPSALAGLEDDPKALGQLMRKMGNEMGEDMGPEFDEVIDRLEKGQSPDEIEEALPDLGGDDVPGGSMGGFDDL